MFRSGSVLFFLYSIHTCGMSRFVAPLPAVAAAPELVALEAVATAAVPAALDMCSSPCPGLVSSDLLNSKRAGLVGCLRFPDPISRGQPMCRGDHLWFGKQSVSRPQTIRSYAANVVKFAA